MPEYSPAAAGWWRMARIGESASCSAVWNRVITISRLPCGTNPKSGVSSGKPSVRFTALSSLFLLHITRKGSARQARRYRSGLWNTERACRRSGRGTQKFVPLEGGRDLESVIAIQRGVGYFLVANHLADASQAYGGLGKRDHVFNRAADVQRCFGGEQDTARADVPGVTRSGGSLSPGAGDRDR